MITKDTILSELRRVAADMGRTPGKRTFEIATGIKESDWMGRHWVRWSEAVAEAGLATNTWQGRITDPELASLLATEARRLGHFPNSIELRMRSNQDAAFPHAKTFQNRGGRAGMVRLVRELCEASPEDWADVLSMLPTSEEPVERGSGVEAELVAGFVYLVRSGQHHKVGMSTDVQRRLLELNTGMPEAGELIHVIRTDDPAGIEAYWHRRFAATRVRPDAEWFALSADDVRAFRRRKFQ